MYHGAASIVLCIDAVQVLFGGECSDDILFSRHSMPTERQACIFFDIFVFRVCNVLKIPFFCFTASLAELTECGY